MRKIKIINLYTIFFIMFIFVILSCGTNNLMLKKLEDEKNKYDKFIDEYAANKYTNKDLRVTLEFDSDWVIIPRYEDFNDFQKKYARLFNSDFSELLFIGFNDEKKIGVRCTCETLNLKLTEYHEKIKSVLLNEITEYGIKFITEAETSLPNIMGYHAVYETKLNDNNIFIFDSILFNNLNNNFKLDLWIEKSLYENNSDYIFSIFKSIDFISKEAEPDLEKLKEDNK